jgi:hypothetical protein
MEIKQIKTTVRIAGTDVPAPIYSLAYRLGEGTPEAVEIVMEQIGHSELYWARISAKRDVDSIVSREEQQEVEGFFDLLKPASHELCEANDRRHQAWQSIQALIDVAKEHIETLGHDGAPS